MSPVVYIGVGNSDDKLGQARWASLCTFVHATVTLAARSPGGDLLAATCSPATDPHQNAVWCLRLPTDPDVVDRLKHDLAVLAGHYDQDGIAWAIAPTTEMLRAAPR